jgi:hypothetical protein
MPYVPMHTIQGLRDQAERCFRLADSVMDEQARCDLVAYGNELIKSAERMEGAEKVLRQPLHQVQALSK